MEPLKLLPGQLGDRVLSFVCPDRLIHVYPFKVFGSYRTVVAILPAPQTPNVVAKAGHNDDPKERSKTTTPGAPPGVKLGNGVPECEHALLLSVFGVRPR
jgi:hypothetical protein